MHLKKYPGLREKCGAHVLALFVMLDTSWPICTSSELGFGAAARLCISYTNSAWHGDSSTK
jgi:hypothetical protein